MRFCHQFDYIGTFVLTLIPMLTLIRERRAPRRRRPSARRRAPRREPHIVLTLPPHIQNTIYLLHKICSKYFIIKYVYLL